MPLTNVSKRTAKGWMKTTPDDALFAYPNGVSANECCFRCNICGQYVTFVVGSLITHHFRHNSAEDDKDCEDRESLNNYLSSNSYSQQSGHIYPVKVRINDIINVRSLKNEIKKIPLTGWLFDEITEEKLPLNANVKVGKNYILLIGKQVNPKTNSFYSDIKINELTSFRKYKSEWYVYRVRADSYTESNYNFFKLYHSFLWDDSSAVSNINQATLVKNKLLKNNSDYKDLINKLNKCYGKSINIDHSFANIIKFFNDDNSIKDWLARTVRNGRIKEDALKMIKSFCLNKK